MRDFLLSIVGAGLVSSALSFPCIHLSRSMLVCSLAFESFRSNRSPLSGVSFRFLSFPFPWLTDGESSQTKRCETWPANPFASEYIDEFPSSTKVNDAAASGDSPAGCEQHEARINELSHSLPPFHSLALNHSIFVPLFSAPHLAASGRLIGAASQLTSRL